MKRPGMVAMLKFMEKQVHDGYAVIFDDLKRFARDTIFHLKLRQELAAYHATVECLNFKFEDTPEGQFVETVIAAQGQLERLQNRRQTLQKMKARVERGYYVSADAPRLCRNGRAPKWGVSLRRGHHEALISFETFQKIQERLTGNARAPARNNLNHDFPLRGFVTCGHCATPLTACWAKGRHDRYPYYFCPKRNCEGYGKSVRREVLEGEFEALLKELQPTESLFRLARAMFEDLWNHRLESAAEKENAFKIELGKVQRSVEQFLDRIADAQLPSVITAYENRIRKLEEQKIVLHEKIANCGRPLRSFDEALRTALDFLANPMQLWISERLEDKRTVLKLAFTERLAYTRNEGF